MSEPGTSYDPVGKAVNEGTVICLNLYFYVKFNSELRGSFDTPEQAEEWYDDQIIPWL